MTTPADTAIEKAAVALSLADPDERGLPEGRQCAEFYRELARAAVIAYLTATMEPSIEAQVAATEEWLTMTAMEDRSAAIHRAIRSAELADLRGKKE